MMIYNVLASNGNTSIPESALYALLGFGVVFLGIAFLIFIVWFVGRAFSKAKIGEKVREAPLAEPLVQAQSIAPIAEDGLDEETVAVIMATLMAYYQQVGPKCEFTVRRIKRI